MYDVIIIGCGPAGMTAAIYALRACKKVLILEKETIGGLITVTPLVENYPGFKQISGMDLGNNLYEQVISLGGQVKIEEVLTIKSGDLKTIVTEDNEYKTKTVIIATGSKPKALGIAEEERFIGNGISFCVSCDGPLYKNSDVAVVGGGNSAIITALSLAEICHKVKIIQNLSYLTAEVSLINRLKRYNNIEIIYNNKVTELFGDEDLNKITIIDNNGNFKQLEISGMFVAVGQESQNKFLKDLITLDKDNYIISDNSCLTNQPGIFVAGDCRQKEVRQLTTAVSDGTVAALSAINYINNKEQF
ncbi:MAG: FAD-dependent oxidoreductase [Tenericutes bacterium]|nr:FAD-dependent oxidoreductase [Mycoplasmatota bacterium]